MQTGQLMASFNALLQQNTLIMQQLALSNNNNTRNYHILPDFSKGIHTFSGLITQVHDNAAREWLECIESTALLHNWPEASGAAKHWFEGRRDGLKCWTDFKRTFVQDDNTHTTLETDDDKSTASQRRCQCILS